MRPHFPHTTNATVLIFDKIPTVAHAWPIEVTAVTEMRVTTGFPPLKYLAYGHMKQVTQ